VGVGSALVSEVGRRAGLDPEGDPQERALCQRVVSELVERWFASAGAGPSGMVGITAKGGLAIGRGEA
jgi:hypothetical protein